MRNEKGNEGGEMTEGRDRRGKNKRKEKGCEGEMRNERWREEYI